LVNREIKIANDPSLGESWGDNPTALMEEVNNEHTAMTQANTINGILNEAAQR